MQMVQCVCVLECSMEMILFYNRMSEAKDMIAAKGWYWSLLS